MRFERGASGACHRVPNACESDPHRACVLMFGFCHARTNAGFALCARARRYEGEFMVRGPVTRVLRRAEGDGELLSGPQVLRRCICDVTGLSMSDDDRELNSPPQHKPRRSEFDGDADGDSINAAFKHGVTDIITFNYWSSKLDEQKEAVRQMAVAAANRNEVLIM